MKTILVLNSKGGCGKTTIATNLAGFFASHNHCTSLMDFDPQGSSMQWLKLRPSTLPKITGIDAGKPKTGVTRSFQLRVAQDVERLIIDAPAGSSGPLLQDLIQRTNMIVVPVGPSAIDVHATTHFIHSLLCENRIRTRGIHVGVVANRVRHGAVYESLQRFLNVLKIPFVTTLNDSDTYIQSAESGIGIHEMADKHLLAEELARWQPLTCWLDDPVRFVAENDKQKISHANVVSFPQCG